MSRYDNFRKFYDEQLKPDLERMDRERRSVRRKVAAILLTTAVAVVLELILIPSGAEAPKIFIPMVTGMAGVIVAGVSSRSFRQEYKEKVISRICGFTGEDISYSPGGFIPETEFRNSRIFLVTPDDYKGEDYFSGRMGDTRIEFSEIEAKVRNTSGSGSDKRDEYTTIFRGILLIADFNKHFRTNTVVLPDTAERLFGKFGQTLQSVSPGRGTLIRLENPDFEKEFCVYGDDQVEARYILTPALMERILAFRKKWKSRISLSFTASRLYIAVNLNRNLFEAPVFRPMADYERTEENLRFLTLLTGVVEDLNLNTRIWTKN